MDRLFRKFERRDEFSAAERQAIEGAVARIVEVPSRAVVVREKVELETSTLLLDGFTCRYKDLPDGQRQILEIDVPGDFVDLHAFILKRLEHNVAALTPARIALVPHDRLTALIQAFPTLARRLWFGTLLDAAIHREWILSVGRRSAIGRVAHLFAELRARLEVVGLADAGGYALPIIQMDLADATGLTSVHVNRMLRALRDRGVLSFRDGRVTIDDLAALHRLAAFDPAYLYLDRRPPHTQERAAPPSD